MNTRYLAYCREQSCSPDAMEIFDRQRYPGGLMTGYILWIDRQWRNWAEGTGVDLSFLSEEDHNSFDRWLNSKAAA